MEKVFFEDDFDDQLIQCDNCNWKGEGREAVIIDLFGISKTQEVHCPKCDNYLGALKRSDRAPGESSDEFSFQIG